MSWQPERSVVQRPGLGRRGILGAAVLGGLARVGARRAGAATLPLSKAPVALNVIDVAGVLAMTRVPIENYRKAKPHLLSRVTMTKAPAPELPGKIRAQQKAGRVDIDFVLGGYDQLAAGLDQDLWLKLLPDHAAALPDLAAIQNEGARKIQDLCDGQGVCIHYSPYGPLFEYMPERVASVPGTAPELLDWCRQHRHRFTYARPLNSGPGRAFIVGLPYVLGDANPRDPLRGWDRTWSFLKALGETIEFYPAGTGEVMKQLGEGSRDIVPSTTGWDINPRALGIVPKEARIFTLKDFRWVIDGHTACIPKGVPDEKVAVLLDLVSFIMTPEQQALCFADGYFYPGPAVRGVTLDTAPPDSRKVIAEFGRPEYERLMTDNPLENPLTPAQTLQAFRRWDEEIGGAKR